MTTSINWPPTLPTAPLRDGYGESHGVLMSATPMDKGPAKLRRNGNKPDILLVNYLLTGAQLDTLETFVKTTLLGVKRFNWVHPRKQVSVEVRLIPSDSDYYTVSGVAQNTWRVSLQLEVLP